MSFPFARAVCICYKERVLSLSFRNHDFTIDRFFHVLWGKDTHKIFFYVFISLIFEIFFNLQIPDSIAHIYLSTKQAINVFFYFFLCFFYYVIRCFSHFEEPFLSSYF